MNGKKENREWAILITVISMTFMATLDSSIVNVALPTMANDLGVSMSGIELVVTSYLIIICALILMFGRFGDMIGKGRIFKFGIAIFTLGSLFCGLAHTLIFLIIARIVQAIGAAAAMATNQGIITQTFPPEKRGKALGLTGTAVALGTMVGPVIGGIIVDSAPWQYIFLINIPVGIAVYISTIKFLNVKATEKKVKFDLIGNFIYIAAIVLLFVGVDFGQEVGYTNIFVILAFVVAVILLIAFVKVENKIENPMIDMSIFKNKLFSLSIFCGFITFVGTGSINIILPFYYQDVLGMTPKGAGLIMTVAPIILAAVAPISGHLSDKLGGEKITFVGLVIYTIGIFSMTVFSQYTSLIFIGLAIGTVALGSGIFQSPNNSLVMSTVDKRKLGVAGSINALVRNLGVMIGTSFSASLLYSFMSKMAGERVHGYIEGKPEIFISSMRYVFIIVGVVLLIGTILTLIRILQKDRLISDDK